MPVTKEDIAGFVDDLQQWGRTQPPKNKKMLNWLLTRALGGDLSAADLDKTNTGAIGPHITALMIANKKVIKHAPTELNWWAYSANDPVGPYVLLEPVGPYLRDR